MFRMLPFEHFVNVVSSSDVSVEGTESSSDESSALPKIESMLLLCCVRSDFTVKV